MSLGAVFDLAGMGMSAQSARLNTTASNLANAQAGSGNPDEVYRARHPVFETVRLDALRGAMGMGSSVMGGSAVGVKVVSIMESSAALQRRYEPNHPKANEEGYVYYPNVSVVEEMADMMSASRSFQMNVEVMNAAKAMMQRTLTLGQ